MDDPEEDVNCSDSRNPSDSYRVGNRHPPLHSRFKKGVSGNRKGRPKHRPPFHETLLTEFRKLASVVLNGRQVKIGHDRLFALQIIKVSVKGGPQSARLLQSAVASAEAKVAEAAAKAEAEAKKQQDGYDTKPFSWTEELEELYRELEIFNQQQSGARQQND